MNPYYGNINTSAFTPYLQEKRGKEEGSCRGGGNKNLSRVLIENHNHSYSSANQRSDYCSSSSSFEPLLPKNGSYNLDAFFDSDIISLDGSISKDEEDPTALVVVNGDSKTRKKKREDTVPPDSTKKTSECLLSYEKYEEPSFSSQGKVLNTSAFHSLRRKVDAIDEKKDDSFRENVPSKKKKIEIKTSPIQALKRKSDNNVNSSIPTEDKVQLSDETKLLGTSLSIEIFEHYKITKFKESDRGCKRDQLEIGYAGLACAYCDGNHGRKGGKYFPSSIKTMADPNKVLLSMHKHLQKCLECPISIKATLIELHGAYDEERANQARGSQRKFYKAIWDDLRKKDVV